MQLPFLPLNLSGARPVLPMGVAPEALVGCTHQITGSKNTYRVNTSFTFPNFYELLTSVMTIESWSRIFDRSDLIGPIVGLSIPLFPPRLPRSWWGHCSYRSVRANGAVTAISAAWLPFHTGHVYGRDFIWIYSTAPQD